MKAKVMNRLRNFWQDESAQGATEYILLLVAIVAVVMMFKGQIMGQMQQAVQSLGAQIQQAMQP